MPARSRSRSPRRHRSRSRSIRRSRSRSRTRQRRSRDRSVSRSRDRSRDRWRRRSPTPDRTTSSSETLSNGKHEEQSSEQSEPVHRVNLVAICTTLAELDENEAVEPKKRRDKERELMKSCGLPVKFDSTFGKEVQGNADNYGVRLRTFRKYRQYMNRRGVFHTRFWLSLLPIQVVSTNCCRIFNNFAYQHLPIQLVVCVVVFLSEQPEKVRRRFYKKWRFVRYREISHY